jgi:hypothetical protein
VGRNQRYDDVPVAGLELRGPQTYRDMILDIGTEEIALRQGFAPLVAEFNDIARPDHGRYVPPGGHTHALAGNGGRAT